MATDAMTTLPEGFVLDSPPSGGGTNVTSKLKLPQGFQLDNVKLPEGFQLDGNAQEMSNTQPIGTGLANLVNRARGVVGSVISPLLHPLVQMFQDDPGMNEAEFGEAARRNEALGQQYIKNYQPETPYGPQVVGALLPGIGPGVVGINMANPVVNLQPPPSDVPLPTAMIAPGRALKFSEEAIMNPLGVATAGLGSEVGPLLKALGVVFGTKIAAEDLPQILGETSVNPTPENVTDATLQALMLGAIGKGVAPKAEVKANLSYEKPTLGTQVLRATPEVTDLRFMPTEGYKGPLPVVGQRPLDIGQQLLQLREERPGMIVAPSEVQPPSPEGLGGQVSFRGEGVPSAMQSKEMVQPPATQMGERRVPGSELGSGIRVDDFDRYMQLQQGMKLALGRKDYDGFYKLQVESEAIKNRNPDRPGMPPTPPQGKAALRPAVNVGGKMLIGNVGDTHADILQRNGIDPNTIPHEDPRRGFVDITKPEQFLDRQQAQKQAGVVGTAKAGGLDSQDLTLQGGQNAVRELRTSSIPEAQSSGDLSKVEKEVRGGAGKQGEAQGGQETRFQSGIDVSQFRQREKELRGPFALMGPRVALDPQQIGFKDVNAPQNAQQTLNRLRNKLTPDEWQIYKDQGIEQAFQGKVAPSAVASWMQEHGPKVEVKTLKQKSETRPIDDTARFLHEMETHGFTVDVNLNTDRMVIRRIGGDENVGVGALPPQLRERATQYLQRIVEDYGKYEDVPGTHWQFVSPKPESEMPGYVEGAVVLPKQFDKKYQDFLTKNKLEDSDAAQRQFNVSNESMFQRGPLEQEPLFPSTHSFPPNTLAFFRGYMEQRPDGGKTFHVIEVQSDWAQQVREEASKREQPAREVQYRAGEQATATHPLLKQYERLALKAAIDHARKEGADRIAVSDAETAMMTEGHDRAAIPVGGYDSNNQMNYDQPKIEQEPGMRLHYDRTLPGILKELTGQEGKRVEFGEHKMAREARPVLNEQTGERGLGQIRPDLIFRNPDFTSKTSISAREFPLDKLSDKAFNVLGKDRPETLRGTFFSGMPLKLERERPRGELEGFWMHYAGNLIPETSDYKVGREVTQDLKPEEVTPLERAMSDDDAKGIETAMAQKGFTKVIRQGDTYFIDNNASLQQLVGLKNKAKAEGREVIQMKLYSGFNPFDSDNYKKLLNFLYGHKVDRDLPEAITHLERKWAGTTTPAHVAANEDVANKMIEYAAAGVTRQVDPIHGQAYKDARLKDWVESGVKAGLYKFAKAGTPNTLAKGEPTVSFDIRAPGIGHKTLQVRADLAPEVDMVLNGVGKSPKAGAQLLLDLATELQVIGPTDVTFHTANMFSSVVKSPGKSSNYLLDQVLRQPGLKHLDAFGRLGYNLYKAIQDDPATQSRLVEVSKLGSLRGEGSKPSLLSQAVGGTVRSVAGARAGEIAQNLTDTGKWIKVLDRAGRLARDKMFDNLVEQGLAKDTPVDRREFINKMGQYLDTLGSKFQAFARNYFSQFVVAGRTFNRNAMESILASNEFRTQNPSAYAKAKISNIIALFSTAVTLPIVANLIITGKPFGRPSVPLGKIDTGKDDEQTGQPIVVDPMKLDLSRRGARNLGVEAISEGVRSGQSADEYLPRAAWAVVQGLLHPWEGPPIRVAEEGVKTYAKTGRPSEALIAAFKAVNPTLTAFFTNPQTGELTVGGEKGGLSAVGKQLETAVGVGKGRYPTQVERVEKAVGKPVGEMSLDERVLGGREVKEEAPPMGEVEAARSAGRAIENEARRGVAIKASLDKSTKQWLDSRHLIVPGYDNKISFGKNKMYLTKQEEQRLDELVKQEYTNTIQAFRESRRAGEFDSLPLNERQEVFHSAMTEAARRARGLLVEELNSKQGGNAQSLSKTRRRKYSVFGQ